MAPPRDPDLHDVTALLRRWQAGDEAALPELMERVHTDLRRIAQNHFRREARHHTLEPTALVHELYLRLAGQPGIDLENRRHFFAVASRVMRRLLIDYARRRRARRRDMHVSLGGSEALGLAGNDGPTVDLLALDTALTDLEAAYPREYRVVELRYLGGLSLEETAATLGIASGTVKRDWRFAKAWLSRELEGARPA